MKSVDIYIYIFDFLIRDVCSNATNRIASIRSLLVPFPRSLDKPYSYIHIYNVVECIWG